jgi:hypothetical protein
MHHPAMLALLLSLLATLRSALRTRAELALESLALRQQLVTLRRSSPRPSLGKDAPEPRAVHPPSVGEIVELPEVGGLHHRYVRKAA